MVRGGRKYHARLAQSAERKVLHLVVVGSSPTVGVFVAVTKSIRCVRSNFHAFHATQVPQEADTWDTGS